MAISNDTVGLVFKLQADSSQAKQEFAKLDNEAKRSLEGLTNNIHKAGRESSIFAQSLEPAVRKIVEGFGLGSDAADHIAQRFAAVKSSALIAGVGITAAVGLIAVGFIEAANKAAELGDQIHDLQQITGLSAETISGLNVAAQEEDKKLDSLTNTLTQFNKNLVDAQRGNKELQGVFKQLGADIRGDTDQAFRQVIERIAGMKDGALKAAAAQKVFGDSAAELIPVINNLNGGIDGAIDKAKELGLFFDNEGAAAASNYKNQIKQLELQFDGLAVRIGNQVVPALTSFLGVLNETGKAINRIISGKDSIGQLATKLLTLGLITQSPSFLAKVNAGVEEPEGESKSPAFKPPKIKDNKQKEKLEEFFTAKDIAKLRAQLAREEEDREIARAKLIEDSEREHLRTMEELNRASDERTLALIKRDLDQQAITEQQAAEQIGAIRIAAFRQREDQLQAEIDSARRRLKANAEVIAEQGENEALADRRAELLAEERKFVEDLEILQEQRAAAEEAAVNEVIDARRRDLESLIQSAQEQRRLREQQLQDQGFGGAAAGAIAGLEGLLGRTLTLQEQFRVVLQGIVADAQTTLPKLSEVFVQSTSAITASVGEMIAAFVSGQSSIRQAVAAFYKAALQPLVDYLLKKARIEFALALADAAAFNFIGAARHAAAGLALAAAAGLIGAGGAAIAGGAGSGTVAPGGGGGGGGNQQSGPRIIDQGGPIRPGPVQIVVRAEPGIIVEHVARDYTNNGQIRRVVRRDTLGEG